MKAILLGILGAVFFSTTFVLNRSMELDGGSWVWSASLRFFFMLPILFIIVGYQKRVKPVIQHIKKNPVPWLVWSTVGFGLFYAPITFATIFGPGWLVAATFQITIVAGSLMVPFLSKKDTPSDKIPLKSIFISLLIVLGVFIMQIEHATVMPIISVLICILVLIVAAFAYPLGNRKTMQLVNGDLNTFQRLLGMTIASLPFWILLSIYGLVAHGLPTSSQMIQTFIVAVSSGIIATTLFFYATELVQGDNQKLAAVEATQSGEVVFALIGEIIFLSTPMPSIVSIFGIVLVVFGMILHSMKSITTKTKISPTSSTKS